MAPSVGKSIKIHEYNEGSIKMANNRFSNGWTRRVDIRYRIVRDAIEKGVVCIEHIRSEQQGVGRGNVERQGNSLTTIRRTSFPGRGVIP